MKISWVRQVVLGFLIFVMASIPMFATEVNGEKKTLRANLTLMEMQYEHIEYAEVEHLMKELDVIIEQDDKEAFYKWDETYYALYCKINTMIQVAQLKYQLHMEQVQYFDEYLYSIDLLGKMKSTYIELFKEEGETLSSDMTKYYELSVERAKLVDKYLEQELNTTIWVKDKELTLLQIIKDETIEDREFFKLYDEWYTAYNKATGEILLDLIKIDNQMAQIQGYKTYVESAYASFNRDYTPQEIKAFIANVKELIPDVFISLYKSNLVSSSILEDYTYESDEHLLQTIRNGFITQNEKLLEAYDYMLKYGLYDIEARNDKVSGGFTTYFDEWAEPYIVINYAAPYETALTMIHEFGHYYSYYAIGDNKGGLDLDETYSQILELLAMPYYNKILGDSKYSKGAEIYTVNNMLAAIIQGCLYDEFLQQVYEDPNMTVDKMNDLYAQLAKDYGIKVDKRSWSNVAHNFQTPYYYISYSVSAVTALELWAQSLEEGNGIESYLTLVTAGDSNSFIKSIESVGLNNPLEKETLNTVIKAVKEYFDVGSKEQSLKKAA